MSASRKERGKRTHQQKTGHGYKNKTKSNKKCDVQTDVSFHHEKLILTQKKDGQKKTYLVSTDVSFHHEKLILTQKKDGQKKTQYQLQNKFPDAEERWSKEDLVSVTK